MCDTGSIYFPWINVDEFFEKGLSAVSSSDSAWYCSYNMYIYMGQTQNSLSIELWFFGATAFMYQYVQKYFICLSSFNLYATTEM